MAYTNNPKLPSIRRDAVRMLRSGYSIRVVARHFGYSPGTICKWSQKASIIGDRPIPTQSSRPKTSPKRIPMNIRDKVSDKRKLLGRSIEVVHHSLKQDGVDISLSSVYRILRDRYQLKRKSPWKKFHRTCKRPKALKPGDLVQMDTIHIMTGPKTRVYVYTLVDVYSRYAFAYTTETISSGMSLKILQKAQEVFPFTISCIQTDHGPEFGKYFTDRCRLFHRHSRIRTPNDNAHVERLNRTIQDECLGLIPVELTLMNKALKKYLVYYNTQRHHFSLDFRAPNAIFDVLSVSKV